MPTEVQITTPRPHPGQAPILASKARFKVVNCGRRFGKTVAAQDEAVRFVLDGWPVGWFAPHYKFLEGPWDELEAALKLLLKSSNKTDRRMKLVTGGSIDFWSLEDADSGRSRKYKHVVVDEAAKARFLEKAWTEAIRATLSDYRGTASFWSAPRGRDYFWKLAVKGQDEHQPAYAYFHQPTRSNPFIDADEIEDARKQLPERVFQQEYDAIFLEDAGGVFRCVAASIDRNRVAPEQRRAVGAYALGVDLARTSDFTVLIVLDNTGRMVYFERFNQISWERQIATIKRVAQL